MQPRGWLPEAFLQPSASPDTGPPLRDLLPTLNSEARLQCLWGSHLILGQEVDGRPSIEVAPVSSHHWASWAGFPQAVSAPAPGAVILTAPQPRPAHLPSVTQGGPEGSLLCLAESRPVFLQMSLHPAAWPHGLPRAPPPCRTDQSRGSCGTMSRLGTLMGLHTLVVASSAGGQLGPAGTGVPLDANTATAAAQSVLIGSP